MWNLIELDCKLEYAEQASGGCSSNCPGNMKIVHFFYALSTREQTQQLGRRWELPVFHQGSSVCNFPWTKYCSMISGALRFKIGIWIYQAGIRWAIEKSDHAPVCYLVFSNTSEACMCHTRMHAHTHAHASLEIGVRWHWCFMFYM